MTKMGMEEVKGGNPMARKKRNHILECSPWAGWLLSHTLAFGTRDQGGRNPNPMHCTYVV